MHKYISKKGFIVINIVLFLMEAILVYLMINTLLSSDVLSPRDISFYEYLKLTIENLV